MLLLFTEWAQSTTCVNEYNNLQACACAVKVVKAVAVDVETDGLAKPPGAHPGDQTEQQLLTAAQVQNGFHAERFNQGDFATVFPGAMWLHIFGANAQGNAVGNGRPL